MRLALPIWGDRISPVFDVAGQLLLIDLAGGSETARRTLPLVDKGLPARVRAVVSTGASVLVCGAISRPLESALLAGGINVMARISGCVQSVIAAYVAGELDTDAFRMPGCAAPAVTSVGNIDPRAGGQRRRRRRCGRLGRMSPEQTNKPEEFQ